MRTLVDIPNAQIEALAALCERANQPRAALVRAAIAEYLAKHTPVSQASAFGLWGADAEDGLAYQDKVRTEW
jgi:predicted transcriptional regulator